MVCLFKIVTWNVNSIRVRLEHLLDCLRNHSPDVVCLQETKVTDDQFPIDAIEAAGYHAVFSGQKTFNGVAILSKKPLTRVLVGFPGFDDPQKRILIASYGDIRVVNLYIPNGSEVGSQKYAYKLKWLDACLQFLKAELKQQDKILILGDYNIAPEDCDVHDPEKWAGKVLVSDQERAQFFKMIDLGFIDTFRLFEHDHGATIYSWWDYRQAGFRRNNGLRIDHILASKSLGDACQNCYIDPEPRKLDRPSDHTPVIAEFCLA